MQNLPDDLQRDGPKDPKRENLSHNAALGIGFAWDLGYIIAVPAVVFGFAGAWLDRTVGTKPLFSLLGIGLAAVLSSIQVFRKIRQILREFPEDLPSKQEDEEVDSAAGQAFHEGLRPKTAKKSYLEELIDQPPREKSADKEP